MDRWLFEFVTFEVEVIDLSSVAGRDDFSLSPDFFRVHLFWWSFSPLLPLHSRSQNSHLIISTAEWSWLRNSPACECGSFWGCECALLKLAAKGCEEITIFFGISYLSDGETPVNWDRVSVSSVESGCEETDILFAISYDFVLSYLKNESPGLYFRHSVSWANSSVCAENIRRQFLHGYPSGGSGGHSLRFALLIAFVSHIDQRVQSDLFSESTSCTR